MIFKNKNLFSIGRLIFKELILNEYSNNSHSNWVLVPFNEISIVQNGFAFKSNDYCDVGCNMIRTRDITSEGFVSNEDLINLPQSFYESKKYKNYKFERLDTITVMVGASIGKMGLITDINIPSLQNQNMWRFRSKLKNISPAFVYYYVEKINKEIINMATGSARSFYRKNLFLDYECIMPSNDYLNGINPLFNSLFDKISENVAEIDKLTKLRDTLLPKLMSGEIDVSKINCDLTLRIMKFILNPLNYINRGINMKTKIISKIQNQMKEYLNPDQYIKLTNSLLNSLQDVDIIDNNNELCEKDNFKLLDLFLSAKQVEGRSPKTITYYKSTIEKMLVKIKKQIYNINTDDLRKYLFDHKNEKQSSKTTIDNIRRILSSFFSWLEDEDYILKNPVRRIHKVKTGRTVKEVLTDENLETLRDKCDEIRDLAMLELLISTGIRVGELVRLNISDIDFYERECVVFGKGESERIVYFDARTKIHLMQYIQQRTDENPALFVSLNKPNTRLGISGIETRLRELGEKCNIKKVHPHKFRRTMATNAIDKGMPIEQVQKLLGHVQIDTTMQYAMVNQSNVKHAHRKFIG